MTALEVEDLKQAAKLIDAKMEEKGILF